MFLFVFRFIELISISGKGNEDKRGIPVTHDVYSKSWLYVNGQPVVCNRHMEVRTTQCRDMKYIYSCHVNNSNMIFKIFGLFFLWGGGLR